jgi:serine/threonine-protein kinase
MKLEEYPLIMDRYLVEGNKVGQGVVELWDATDQQLERPVIIQILTEKAAQDPDLCANFQKHQQITSSIHNSVVQGVYDAGEWEDRPFSVMQKCEGVSPGSVYRSGYPPDVPLVLGVARQVAEGLQSCRDAGLVDWALSAQTVQIDAEGNAHFPIIEGEPSEGNRENDSEDVATLNSLLRLMLTGRPDTSTGDLRWALVPGAVVGLLERLDPGRAGGIATAGEAANEIKAIEAASMQPTQAYEPDAAMAEAELNQGAARIAPAAALDRSEAPTMVAPVLPATAYDPNLGRTRQTELSLVAEDVTDGAITLPVAAYAPPAPVAEKRVARVTRKPPPRVLLPLLGLLLLAVVGVVLAKAISSAGRADGQSLSSASATSTPAASAKQAAIVPDLRGKDLEEARGIADTAGLNMGATTSSYNATYDAGQIAEQQPAPGEQVEAGSYITVTLSLGPEPAAEQPAPNPPPANPPPKGKPDDKGRHKGKDK